VGQATDITERITTRPLSAEELADRRAGERVQENVETTLDGQVVERIAPAAAPQPTFQAQPSTWD
jgi:hypothetical protein